MQSSVQQQRRRSTKLTRKSIVAASNTTTTTTSSTAQLTSSTDKNVCLDRIIGSTSKTNNSFSLNTRTEELAYTAGNVIVIYDSKQNKQSFIRRTKQVISVQFSLDGRYLAAGEKGKSPCAYIWKINDGQQKRFSVIGKISYHKFGIASLCFDNTNEFLMTYGEHDGLVSLWNISDMLKDEAPAELTNPVATGKIQNPSGSLSCAYLAENRVFVTAGKHHLKSWSIDKFVSTNTEEDQPAIATRRCSYRASDISELTKDNKNVSGGVAWESKGATLNNLRAATFIDTVCFQGKCYAVTSDGHLCSFILTRGRLILEQTINLKAQPTVNALCVSQKWICCSFANGGIQCVDRNSFDVSFSLPKPRSWSRETSSTQPDAQLRYPDSLTCALLPKSDVLFSIYSDGSFIGWDFSDYPNVKKQISEFSHNQCIWDMQLISASNDSLPANCLVTCSADNTIRFWDTDLLIDPNQSTNEPLHQVIHIDDQYQALKKSTDATANTQHPGIRCIAVSPDQQYIASGDRAGNVRIHHIPTNTLVNDKVAHDNEVLSLCYSSHEDGLLASAGRDRLVHIFDCKNASAENVNEQSFPHLTSLDEHSSIITAIKFAYGSTEQAKEKDTANNLHFISCSSDKSIIFRTIQPDRANFQVKRYSNSILSGAVYGMCVDDQTNTIITNGKDRKISRYSIETGKLINEPIPIAKESGDSIRISLHNSGQYSLVTSTDTCFRIYHCETENKENKKKTAPKTSGKTCLAVGRGPSFITCAYFTPCSSRVIASTSDGLIAVYRLHSSIVKQLQAQSVVPVPVSESLSEPITASTNDTSSQLLSSLLLNTDSNSVIDSDSLSMMNNERKTWSSVEEVSSSLVSNYGLVAPKVPDIHGFDSFFSRNDDITATLRRLTIEPTSNNGNQAVMTDTKALAGALLESDFSDDFFDFEQFSDINLPSASRLSISRAFREKSPAANTISVKSAMSSSSKKKSGLTAITDAHNILSSAAIVSDDSPASDTILFEESDKLNTETVTDGAKESHVEESNSLNSSGIQSEKPLPLELQPLCVQETPLNVNSEPVIATENISVPSFCVCVDTPNKEMNCQTPKHNCSDNDTANSNSPSLSSPNVFRDIGNLLKDHTKNIKDTKLQLSEAPATPKAPSKQTANIATVTVTPTGNRRHTLSNKLHLNIPQTGKTRRSLGNEPRNSPSTLALQNNATSSLEDAELPEEQMMEDSAYRLAQRHQLALNMLRDAFDNCVMLYEDINAEYENVRLFTDSESHQNDAYVYEKILDDYDTTFASISERLGDTEIFCHTPPQSPKMQKFSDMLVQLAGMLHKNPNLVQ